MQNPAACYQARAACATSSRGSGSAQRACRLMLLGRSTIRAWTSSPTVFDGGQRFRALTLVDVLGARRCGSRRRRRSRCPTSPSRATRWHALFYDVARGRGVPEADQVDNGGRSTLGRWAPAHNVTACSLTSSSRATDGQRRRRELQKGRLRERRTLTLACWKPRSTPDPLAASPWM